MAKKQVVSYTYTCDVCGSAIPDSDAGDATHKVSWEGSNYVLDVCSTHSSLLGDLLNQVKEFVDAGHRGGAGARTPWRTRPVRRRRQAARGPGGGNNVVGRYCAQAGRSERHSFVGPGQRAQRWRPGPYLGIRCGRVRRRPECPATGRGAPGPGQAPPPQICGRRKRQLNHHGRRVGAAQTAPPQGGCRLGIVPAAAVTRGTPMELLYCQG